MSTSLLLVSDPGVPAALAQDLSSSLRETLADISASDREWLISAQEGTYRLTEQATFAEVMQGVDPANQPQDIVVYLTDLPRRDGTLPVVADISVPGRFGVVSVACMGGLFIRRRVRDTVTGVVAEIEDQPDRPAHVGRLRRTEDEHSVRYTAPPPFARLRLLIGMVYANRPWRLAAGLSRVMMATFATGAVSLAYPTIWQLSATMGPWRQSATTFLATAAMVGWLIVNHELWERPRGRIERERAALYNASTVITLTIGVVVLHLSSFVLLLLTAWWTLPPTLLGQNLGHAVGPSDYLRLAWLVAAVATLGGALGSGLEDDNAVKQAAYGARQQQRFRSERV
ncbi:hypothetical protein SAMN04489835_3068 [Mycolicibacterium rutilum]|uniref:5,10-methylene-tetrahydrofolate dehydrogenase n=1 Tax=Mycolicibacterium rutilum TaxID=370526 RepID=A0A1H6KF54_MYCRU|nr:hypothetical protein [Mycolicibacterium rutilum]SEH70444.1 hypothetical protein SAMN04489835_3068 [Mycolicibacterium rutilum]